MGIGKMIRTRREALKLTQAELAKMIGVTPSAITNYESDLSHPKEKVLYQLFEALECDANYLFADVIQTKTPPPLTAEESKLLNYYNNLNSTGQRMLMEHATMMTASGLYKKEPSKTVFVAARNGNPPTELPDNPDEFPDAPDTI